jgi:hypothetical protein
MGPVEMADEARGQHVFAGLAARSGFSIRECEVAAVSGRLADVVRVAQLRRRRLRRESPTRRGSRRNLTGAQTLSRLQLMRATWDDEG